jgi:hypothetical protein
MYAKRGRVQNVPIDIDDGDGATELMLEQVMTMAQWNPH